MHLSLMIRFVHFEPIGMCVTDSVLPDISRNVSCGGSGREWFTDGTSASGVRQQSLWDA